MRRAGRCRHRPLRRRYKRCNGRATARVAPTERQGMRCKPGFGSSGRPTPTHRLPIEFRRGRRPRRPAVLRVAGGAVVGVSQSRLRRAVGTGLRIATGALRPRNDRFLHDSAVQGRAAESRGPAAHKKARHEPSFSACQKASQSLPPAGGKEMKSFSLATCA